MGFLYAENGISQFELSASPMGPYRLGLLSHVIFFIVHFNLQVLIGGIVADSMLCYLCIGYKIEMLLAVEMVSSVMPVPKVKIGLGSRNCIRIVSSSCVLPQYLNWFLLNCKPSVLMRSLIKL